MDEFYRSNPVVIHLDDQANSASIERKELSISICELAFIVDAQGQCHSQIHSKRQSDREKTFLRDETPWRMANA